MATIAGRSRARGGPGRLQWIALSGAAIVILGLTFALGMLVGRQWARQTPVSVESTRKTAAVPRRGGLTEPPGERAAARQEKLTFYQTLTAPLGAVPLSGNAPVTPKSEAAVKPRSKHEAAPERGQERVPPRAEELALPGRTAVGASNPERSALENRTTEAQSEPGAEWVIQVGVFKSSQQAERVRKQLADGGFPARLTPMTADDGQLRYRVRVGAFRTKDEALKTADRIRSDRSLPTFVTAN